MRKEERFDEHEWLKEEYLWPLRKQITLGSLFISDYRNSFGISAEAVCDFFTDFWDIFCEELAKEDGVWEQAESEYQRRIKEHPELAKKLSQHDVYLEISQKLYDNEETLLAYYQLYQESNPLTPNWVNVDIHWDFARSIRVIAEDEDDAEDIVEDMMRNGEIPQSSFEATEDWELDTSYQPN